ncbi:hypothetical protein LUZ60_000855 [Juncus effusus]|nr:hypothetical protein LUZ60_000855 [Juncus effusus]
MESPLLLLLFFSLASSLFVVDGQVNVAGLTNSAEAQAVKGIYQAWNIKDSGNYIDQDPCSTNGSEGSSWPHLNCTPCHIGVPSLSCHIISLDLSGFDIGADLSLYLPNLTKLTMLESLKLSGCNLKGSIDGIEKLTNLTSLDLSKNLLSGPVSYIDSLSKLEHLDLSINLFNGSVSTLQNLGNLTYLNFGSNNFSGSLPQLGNSKLRKLYFDSSGVNGSLGVLGSLKELQVLWAFDNPISGKLSDLATGEMKNLTELRIYGTFIKGPITQGFNQLNSLVTLIIGDLGKETNSTESRSSAQSDSDFSFLSEMKNLTILSLRNCSLTGSNFQNISLLPNLKYLDLSFNHLQAHDLGANIIQNKFPALEQLYLGGGNNISGHLPDLIAQNLKELDVSFNSIYGDLLVSPNLHINYLGTPINAQPRYDNSNVSQILNGTKNNSSGNIIRNFTSKDYIAIKCGGNVQNLENIYYYQNDTNPLSSADLSFDPNNFWLVSNIASFPTNESTTTYNYTVSTNNNISKTNSMDPGPLYQTARTSQSSLSYYIVGLPNANDYTVELHFAEIVIGDPTTSWTGLGKRFFNIKVLDKERKDFNIMDKANELSNAAVIFPFYDVMVKNGYIDIELVWNGRGTCCIPEAGTYGPLISAIRIYRGKTPPPLPPSPLSPHNISKGKVSKRVGIVVGIFSLGLASVVITSSVVFLWWEWIQIGQEMKY